MPHLGGVVACAIGVPSDGAKVADPWVGTIANVESHGTAARGA